MQGNNCKVGPLFLFCGVKNFFISSCSKEFRTQLYSGEKNKIMIFIMKKLQEFKNSVFVR